MSKISLSPDASGTGIFTIASPNSNTNRTLTLPDDTGTIVTNSGNQAGSFTTLNTSGAVVFNDAGADVDFRVEGDTDANLLFVDASTDRIGIGTNTPAVPLDIDIGTDNNAIYCRSSDQYCNIALTDDVGSVKLGSDNGSLFFETGGTTSFTSIIERMRIDGSSGNVGIGMTPSNIATGYLIQINGGTQSFIAIGNTTDGDGPLNGLVIGNDASGADIYQRENKYLRFHTNNTERARITSGGFLKAKGNETNYISTTGAYHEFINGTGDTIVIYARNTSATPYGYYVDFTTDPNNATNYVFGADSGGNLVYRIFSNGTTSARSDAKWKKNIETARDGYIDDLARLRVVKYNWHNHEDGTPKEMGLIAQEVEEVFPGLVQEDEEKRDEVRTREIPAVLDEDGNEVEPARTEEYTEQVGTGEYTKSIKFSVFTPMLIKAVQELKAITDTQAQTIATLEARIAALETGV